jgi:hypothetical protein
MALWIFGLSTTVLLVGMWGRAVAADNEALEAGARAVLESDVVSGRVTSWIADGIESGAQDLPAGLAADAAVAVWSRPETREALAQTIDRLVEAALAPPGTSVPIDLAATLEPLAPVVADELAVRGVALPASIVEAAFEELPSLALSTEAELSVASAVAGARSALTRVVAVGLLGMALSGAAAVMLAEERARQVRGLAVRVGVSAFTFALLLRIGAWALDPQGGRSPLAAGGAVILASSGHILLMAALVAAGVALFATFEVRRRRRAAVV